MIAQRAKVRLAAPKDLVATAIGNVLGTGTGLLFVLTLLHRTPTLAGWTAAEVMFIWGFAECVIGLFYVFFSGLSELNRRYLLGGEMDRLLLRPLDPLVQLLADNISIDDIPSALVGAIAMAWALPEIPAAQLLWLLPVWILGAVLALGGMSITFASLGFYLHHRGTTFGLLLHFARYARWPIDAFPRPIAWGLTILLPLAWTGFYPAAMFLGHEPWSTWGLLSPFAAVIALWVGVTAWRSGLTRYASSGT